MVYLEQRRRVEILPPVLVNCPPQTEGAGIGRGEVGVALCVADVTEVVAVICAFRKLAILGLK